MAAFQSPPLPLYFTSSPCNKVICRAPIWRHLGRFASVMARTFQSEILRGSVLWTDRTIIGTRSCAPITCPCSSCHPRRRDDIWQGRNYTAVTGTTAISSLAKLYDLIILSHCWLSIYSQAHNLIKNLFLMVARSTRREICVLEAEGKEED